MGVLRRRTTIPASTGWPYSTVVILLPESELSSSKVRTSRLLWVFAHVAYAPRLFFTQVSPVLTEQSCMSLQRFGMTNETCGSWV